jgi:hypothetical protein
MLPSLFFLLMVLKYMIAYTSIMYTMYSPKKEYKSCAYIFGGPQNYQIG